MPVTSNCAAHILGFRSRDAPLSIATFGMLNNQAKSCCIFDYLCDLQLILADKTEQFSLTYGGCLAVNPGSFSGDFSFIVYRPSSKEVEFSKVPS